jgi:hypothetical protein
MMVILVSAALVSFLLCLAAGRYAGWYGVVVPIALVVPFACRGSRRDPVHRHIGSVAGLGFSLAFVADSAPGRHRRSTPLEDGYCVGNRSWGHDRVSGRPQSACRRN